MNMKQVLFVIILLFSVTDIFSQDCKMGMTEDNEKVVLYDTGKWEYFTDYFLEKSPVISEDGWEQLVPAPDITYNKKDLIKTIQDNDWYWFEGIELSNGEKINYKDWEEHLEQFVLSFPEIDREIALEMISRYEFEYDFINETHDFYIALGDPGPGYFAISGSISDLSANTLFLHFIAISAREWLYTYNLSIKIDNSLSTFTNLPVTQGPDWTYTYYQETITYTLPDRDSLIILEGIASSVRTMIRFVGEKGNLDFEISSDNKKKLIQILEFLKKIYFS